MSPAVRERFHEELDQRARERRGVIALTAFRFHFDHVARSSEAGNFVGTTPQQAATGRSLWIARRVDDYILGFMTYRFGAKLDLVSSCEVKDRLPCVLEAIGPAARNAVRRIAPAELVYEPPAPLAHMRQRQLLHVQASLTFIGVFLDVQEVGPVRCQDGSRCSPLRHRTSRCSSRARSA